MSLALMLGPWEDADWQEASAPPPVALVVHPGYGAALPRPSRPRRRRRPEPEPAPAVPLALLDGPYVPDVRPDLVAAEHVRPATLDEDEEELTLLLALLHRRHDY